MDHGGRKGQSCLPTELHSYISSPKWQHWGIFWLNTRVIQCLFICSSSGKKSYWQRRLLSKSLKRSICYEILILWKQLIVAKPTPSLRNLETPGKRLAELHESDFCIAYISVLAADTIVLAFCSPHVTSWNLHGLQALRLPAKYLKKESSSSPLSFFSFSTWGENSLISLGDDRKLEEIQSWFFKLKGLFPFISFISIRLKVMRLCRSDFKGHNFEMMCFA